jgi:hypothetical protein
MVDSVWLRTPSPLQAAAWCLIAAALAVVVHLCNLRTPVEISSDGSLLRCTVAGTVLETEVDTAVLGSVSIWASPSLIPPGGRFIEVEAEGAPVFREPLPSRFALPRGGWVPVGDWHVDRRAVDSQVFEHTVGKRAPWTVRTELRGRPLTFVTFMLRNEAGAPLASVKVRRGMINNDLMIANARGRNVAVTELRPRPLQHLVAAVSTLAAGLAVAATFIALIFSVTWLAGRCGRSPAIHNPFGPAAVWIAVIILAAAGATLSAWVAIDILECVPHIPDSVAYVLQAKWLLHGAVTQELRPFQEQLNVPFTFVHHGRWVSQYPIGWPILLAIGQALGKPWLVSPLLRAVYVIVLFLLGRELYSSVIGVIAALLAVVSPMSTLVFATHMSHAGSGALLLTFAWLFLAGRRRRQQWMMLASGVCLGYAFGIRPLTAFAVAIPFGILGLDDLSRNLRSELSHAIAFVAGGVVGAAPTMIGNAIVTGSPFSFPYSFVYGDFYSLSNIPDGLRNLDLLLVHAAPALFGWGWPLCSPWVVIGLGSALAFVPFLLGRRERSDVLLAVLFIEVALAYLPTRWNGLHGYGARYYFEIFFVIYLLTARGFQELARVGVGRLKTQWTAWATILLFVVLNATTVATLPARLAHYCGYNHVDGLLEQAIADQKVDHGLVLFGFWQWYDWGRAARLHQASPDADLVFACRRGNLDALLRYYEGRPIYLWNDLRLVPVERE